MINDKALRSNYFSDGKFQSLTTSFMKQNGIKTGNKYSEYSKLFSKKEKNVFSPFDIDDTDENSYVL